MNSSLIELCKFGVLFVLISCFAMTATSSEKITFGVYTSDKASTMFQTFKPVLDGLSKELKLLGSESANIQIKIYKTYEEGIQAIVTGEVDFMRMGPASYILAKEQSPKIKLLAMELRKNKKRFKGVIIVPSDSDVTSLSQLKGKRFAFGNKNSTIGRYLAQSALIDAGVYQKDLSNFAFLGRHDKVAFAVGLKDYDAGSVKEKTFKKLSKKTGKIKALKYFENVTKPWVASPALSDEQFSLLSKALINLKDESVLKKLKVTGFASSTDEDYAFVRKGMESAKMF